MPQLSVVTLLGLCLAAQGFDFVSQEFEGNSELPFLGPEWEGTSEMKISYLYDMDQFKFRDGVSMMMDMTMDLGGSGDKMEMKMDMRHDKIIDVANKRVILYQHRHQSTIDTMSPWPSPDTTHTTTKIPCFEVDLGDVTVDGVNDCIKQGAKDVWTAHDGNFIIIDQPALGPDGHDQGHVNHVTWSVDSSDLITRVRQTLWSPGPDGGHESPHEMIFKSPHPSEGKPPPEVFDVPQEWGHCAPMEKSDSALVENQVATPDVIWDCLGLPRHKHQGPAIAFFAEAVAKAKAYSSSHAAKGSNATISV